MKLKTKITTTFNNSVTYTTSTGQELKFEIIELANEQNRNVNEFKTQKI